KDYAGELRKTIDLKRTRPSSPTTFEWSHESDETTHISIVDGDRNAVSMTYTLEQGYGSKITVPGAGFLLNNEMGDFNPGPELTTAEGLIGTKPNLAEPGKRMLSSMTPTILTRDGRLFMVTGSPGGRTIINTVLETIVNVADFGMNAQEAVDAPRFHHQWLPDRISYEKYGFSADTVAALEKRGHVLQVNQGSLYPALHRLEHRGWIEAEWGISELGRRARFYRLTAAGRRQLDAESADWQRLSAAINRVLRLA